MKLLVVGGSGFVGQAVLRAAVQMGALKVTSFSRTGHPSNITWPHSDRVTWLKGDATKPDPQMFKDYEIIIHTVGTLLAHESWQMPWHKKSKPQGYGTYETVNYQSAINVKNAWQAASENSKSAFPRTFLYVSSAGSAPGLDSRYLSTKRRAETDLTEQAKTAQPPYRTLIVRPGFLYGEGRSITPLIAAATNLSLNVLHTARIRLDWMEKVAPMTVDGLAKVILQLVQQQDLPNGHVVDCDELRVLSQSK